MIQVAIDGDAFLIFLKDRIVPAQTKEEVIDVARKHGVSLADVHNALIYAVPLAADLPAIEYHPGARRPYSISGVPTLYDVAVFLIRQSGFTAREARNILHVYKTAVEIEEAAR